MRAWTCVACSRSLKVRVPCAVWPRCHYERPLTVGTAAVTVYDDVDGGRPVHDPTIGMTKIASLGLRNIILELNVACKRSG